jgi:tetratricopeptide (TPR) repeat protein
MIEKGIKAEKEKKFLSAQHFFENAIRNVPGNTEARAHLLIAAFHNNDLSTLANMADTLSGKPIDDDNLLQEVQALMDKAANYFPSDSFISLEKKYGTADSIPDSAFANFIKEHGEEIFPRVLYASALYDRKAYIAADTVLKEILETDNENINAQGMMSSLKRLEDKPTESLKYCDQLLNINRESTYGLSTKARTLLKMKKNKEGLKLAKESFELDSTDLYSKATLALAYHFNNLIKERDELVNKTMASKDPAVATYFQFVLDVISNKDHL